MERRLFAAGGAIGVGLVLVLSRLIQLTLVQGESLASQAAVQHRQRIVLTPRRGAIVDRHNVPLALSTPVESFFVRPRKLPTGVDTQVPALAAALHISPQEVNRALHAPAPFVWLKRQATSQEAAQVRALNITGVESIETQRRFYPQGTLAAPIIGFTNIDAEGLEGVEFASERYLRGEPAEVLRERDAFGRTMRAQGQELPPDALNVRLTLDAGLQYLAERELDRRVRETRALAGTVIILDPQTFAILALAQVPRFDPNTPNQSPAETRRNRAISDCYEPGSTLKTLLAAAALDMNVVRPEEQVFCELGQYPVGKHTIHDHHPYGWLSVAEVLQHSSNIGAAKIGERVGKEVYHSYLRAFGLGVETGIDLPGEIAGLLPAVQQWARINLVTASFGHGVAVTPLQLACAYAALANDGVLMRPYLIREVFDADDKLVVANSPQRLRQVVRTETAHRVMKLLEKVIEKEGTGWRARIEGVPVAGKTGTSQKINGRGGYSARGRIASFVGIVPADQPRLVILVTIDEPKTGTYGGEIAAPVFQAIARHALGQLGIDVNAYKLERASVTVPPVSAPPSLRRSRALGLTPAASALAPVLATGPSFLGLSLREAIQKARREGWRITTAGSGYVIRQGVQTDPEDGQSVYTLLLSPTNEAHP
jgi:cell division protein FtsI (penicillin-binding protein 3)